MVNTNPNTRKDRNGRWAHHFIADNLRRVVVGIDPARIFREKALFRRIQAVEQAGYAPLTAMGMAGKNQIKIHLFVGLNKLRVVRN